MATMQLLNSMVNLRPSPRFSFILLDLFGDVHSIEMACAVNFRRLGEVPPLESKVICESIR